MRNKTNICSVQTFLEGTLLKAVWRLEAPVLWPRDDEARAALCLFCHFRVNLLVMPIRAYRLSRTTPQSTSTSRPATVHFMPLTCCVHWLEFLKRYNMNMYLRLFSTSQLNPTQLQIDQVCVQNLFSRCKQHKCPQKVKGWYCSFQQWHHVGCVVTIYSTRTD